MFSRGFCCLGRRRGLRGLLQPFRRHPGFRQAQKNSRCPSHCALRRTLHRPGLWFRIFPDSDRRRKSRVRLLERHRHRPQYYRAAKDWLLPGGLGEDKGSEYACGRRRNTQACCTGSDAARGGAACSSATGRSDAKRTATHCRRRAVDSIRARATSSHRDFANFGARHATSSRTCTDECPGNSCSGSAASSTLTCAGTARACTGSAGSPTSIGASDCTSANCRGTSRARRSA